MVIGGDCVDDQQQVQPVYFATYADGFLLAEQENFLDGETAGKDADYGFVRRSGLGSGCRFWDVVRIFHGGYDIAECSFNQSMQFLSGNSNGFPELGPEVGIFFTGLCLSCTQEDFGNIIGIPGLFQQEASDFREKRLRPDQSLIQRILKEVPAQAEELQVEQVMFEETGVEMIGGNKRTYLFRFPGLGAQQVTGIITLLPDLPEFFHRSGKFFTGKFMFLGSKNLF